MTVRQTPLWQIEAPVSVVFDRLSQWGLGAPFWPHRLAVVERQSDRLDHMRVLLCGWPELPFGLGNRLLGFRVVPLFRLHAMRIQATPAQPDNARYLLYECSGGYPIGLLALYVRTAIAEEGKRRTKLPKTCRSRSLCLRPWG